MEVFLLL
jgi:hypothetical protein